MLWLSEKQTNELVFDLVHNGSIGSFCGFLQLSVHADDNYEPTLIGLDIFLKKNVCTPLASTEHYFN